ncbi:FAD binding domain-containing protein [Streptomyces sp. NPDC050848]|uniref:FAD binding domain-containing protein n=1 Tax=Streptomyces sp. NPDC050848 TaxID=3155791 RepID=UPI0033F846D3
MALDAVIQVRSLDGSRSIPVLEFFLRPGDTPQNEHSLRPGELITSLTVPAGSAHAPLGISEGPRQAVVRVRPRVRSGGAGHQGRRGTGRRVAVGGVATVPWRLPKVEEALVGKRPGRRTWTDAAALAAEGAVPPSENAFKVRMVERTVRRQLMTIGGQ